MGKSRPILYNALLLTGVNLLLRFISTSFQVYLSGKIGAAGIGLLQLVLSVGSLSLTVGMGGIKTATMYLSAEAIGQKRSNRMVWILSGCVLYSVLVSAAVGIGLFTFAPWIAENWIGNTMTVSSVRLLAAFLPVNCLCGVMVGYFTGVHKIRTLAGVEILEQVFSMVLTVLLLSYWAGSDTARACLSVIFGSGLGSCLTLLILMVIKNRELTAPSARFNVRKKLWQTAVPLAVADDLKAGINTTENIMVPKRLALYPGSASPLAEFGMVCGMVFPLLMFPAAILFGLAELLIPEMARCNAAGSQIRIKYLTEKSILIALIYGCFCGGILFLGAESLCMRFYKTGEAGIYLRWFAILAPMLYCDAIVDAITKGLGQQKKCVRNNIITSAMDVILLFILLPRYGMKGYFVSFLITHMVNFGLSFKLLLGAVGKLLPIFRAIHCLLSAILSVRIAMRVPDYCQEILFTVCFIAFLILFGCIQANDFIWIQRLLHKEEKRTAQKTG